MNLAPLPSAGARLGIGGERTPLGRTVLRDNRRIAHQRAGKVSRIGRLRQDMVKSRRPGGSAVMRLRTRGQGDDPHRRRARGQLQIAESLGLTDRTVRRDWEKARLLLAHALRL